MIHSHPIDTRNQTQQLHRVRLLRSLATVKTPAGDSCISIGEWRVNQIRHWNFVGLLLSVRWMRTARASRCVWGAYEKWDASTKCIMHISPFKMSVCSRKNSDALRHFFSGLFRLLRVDICLHRGFLIDSSPWNGQNSNVFNVFFKRSVFLNRNLVSVVL